MNKVISWADENKATITLECGSSVKGWSNMELSMWYRRFGFERVDLRLPIRMIRKIY